MKKTCVGLIPLFCFYSIWFADEAAFVDCDNKEGIMLFARPSKNFLGVVKCGEKVKVLRREQAWTRVRPGQNVEGYISSLFLSGENPQSSNAHGCYRGH